MLAVDTNVLVYAHRRDSPFHEASFGAIRALAEGRRAWVIPWPCVHEFYSVVTNPRIYEPPSTPDEALDQLDAWASSPTVRFLGESDDHLARLATLLQTGRIVGAKVHDARVAAICLTHGVESLISLDRDFSRFPQLTVESPLTGS